MLDIISIVAGAVAAAVIAIVLFTQRKRIAALRERASQQVSSTQQHLSRTLETRYRDAVIEFSNSQHVAGHLVELERVAVLPRFHKIPVPFDPDEDEPEGVDDPFNLVPHVADYPQALGPFQVTSLPLKDMLRDGDSLAVLGLPGSGRTVALNLIAILLARQTGSEQEGGLLDDVRLPILVHLANLDLSAESWLAGSDVLEPLIAAAGQDMAGSGRALGGMRGNLADGAGIILVDGWDELPYEHRAQAINWLKTLIEFYPGNQIVMTGPASGYAPLITELGLLPTSILPWSRNDAEEVANLWAAAWSAIDTSETEQKGEIAPSIVQQAIAGTRGRSPLDTVLKVWATYAGDAPGMLRHNAYSAYVDHVNPSTALREGLARIARYQLENPELIGLTVEDAIKQVDGARKGADERAGMLSLDYIHAALTQTRILVERTGELISFRHPVIAAYLAAESLRDASFQEALITGKSHLNPLVMPFLAGNQDITPYVEYQLNSNPTIRLEGLLSAASWAADADPRAEWRGPVFKKLAQAFLTPNQFPLVRERVLAALVASRDPNVTFIFKQGLKSQSPLVRIAAAVGIGAIGDPEQVTTLGEVLQDQVPAVQVAAVLALGAIGTKAALNYMIETLLTSTDMPRRAVAEMLATNLAGEGHEVLREALEDEDAMTRRAAIYGLRRVNTDWVWQMLEEARRLDSQWLVRNAAAAALDAFQEDTGPQLERVYPPHQTPWLVAWLENRDEIPEEGALGVRQMIQAMQEGDERRRLAAIETLGALAEPDAVNELYTMLRDSHPDIRDSAFRALGTISQATGQPLPAVS